MCIQPDNADKKYTLYFLLIGLSASVPIMISPKQMGFYAHPSLIYFCLAFSCLLAFTIPVIENALMKIPSKVYMIFYSTVFPGLVIYLIILFGKPGRDEALLADAARIEQIVGRNATISAPLEISNEFLIIAYLQRYYGIIVDYKSTKPSSWIITRKNGTYIGRDSGAFELKRYILYKK
jgi:hypothetical protein